MHRNRGKPEKDTRGVLVFNGGGAASSGSVTAGERRPLPPPATAFAGNHDMEAQDEEEEQELELGLSLGAAAARGAPRYRILTARDFPALAPRGSSPPASPSPSNSSVSSSSGAQGTATGDGKDSAEAETACRRAVGSSNQVQVVGWPPIRAFRMNSLFHLSKDNTTTTPNSYDKKASDEKKEGKKGRSFFVKVNMDGDPIGRKVDLNSHHSYQSLASALELMFQAVKSLKLLDGSFEFKLTYEDKDGDWMLVGDVPWGMFLETVKRLRIMRTSDTTGLVPRHQSSNKLGGLIGSKLS